MGANLISMPSPRRHLSVDELTQRASTGLAIRRGEVKISEPIPSSYMHNGAEMDQMYEQVTPRMGGSYPNRDDTDSVSHGRSISSNVPGHVSRFTERTSPVPSSNVNNTLLESSQGNVLQRRNTGLRATIRRMFGSKRDKSMHSRGMSTPIEPSRILSMTGPQSAHLPVYMQASRGPNSGPLDSHALAPYQRVESADIIHSEPDTRQMEQRRNTLPNLLLGTLEETVEQNSRASVAPVIDQRPRTAVKQPSNLPVQHNRRSRSAEGLGDLSHLAEKPRHYRDRSGEIAYWRNSVIMDPLPILTNTRDESLPQVRSDFDQAVPRPSVEPVQDFDFGLTRTPVPSTPTTLLDRVNTIEVKLYDFEFALSKLQGTEIADSGLQQPQIKGEVVERTFSEMDARSIENSDSKNVSHSAHVWQRPGSKPRRSPDRTSKATTIKARNQRTPSDRSQTPSVSSARITNEQYTYLYELIREERIAREHLEAQVIHLQKEMDILKSPMYTYTQQTYPTPSPDSFHNSHDLPVVHSTQSPLMHLEQNVKETSRFSMTETDSDDDDVEAGNIPAEVYQTPQEQNFHFDARRNMLTPMI